MEKSKKQLDINALLEEANSFAQKESNFKNQSLFGVTDGKAVGTYLEHKFQDALQEKHLYVRGSSAKGIDFPELNIDIKVTSIKQPQSSCPFRSARQKIYGLGYSLLVSNPMHCNGGYNIAVSSKWQAKRQVLPE